MDGATATEEEGVKEEGVTAEGKTSEVPRGRRRERTGEKETNVPPPPWEEWTRDVSLILTPGIEMVVIVVVAAVAVAVAVAVSVGSSSSRRRRSK